MTVDLVPPIFAVHVVVGECVDLPAIAFQHLHYKIWSTDALLVLYHDKFFINACIIRLLGLSPIQHVLFVSFIFCEHL